MQSQMDDIFALNVFYSFFYQDCMYSILLGQNTCHLRLYEYNIPAGNFKKYPIFLLSVLVVQEINYHITISEILFSLPFYTH